MDKFLEISVESKDRFILHLLKQGIGFQATHIKREQSVAEETLATDSQSSTYKRINYFAKENGVYALLYFDKDQSDPSRQVARIAKVHSTGNEEWLHKLEVAISTFKDDSSEAIGTKDRALMLLHETMALWSTDTKEYFRKAIPLAEATIAMDPSLTRAYNCKGSAQASLGHNDDAIRTYLAAIKTNSHCVRPWLNLGNRYSVNGPTDRSLFAYRIGVDRPPLWDGDSKIQSDSMRHLKNIGDQNAETAFLLASRNLEIDELFSQAHLASGGTFSSAASQGVKYGRKGEWNKALDAFSMAVDRFPKDAMAINNKAYALIQVGKFAEAITCCDKALALVPHSFAVEQTRFEAMLMLGKTTEVLYGLTRLAESDPDNLAVTYYLALLEDEMGLAMRAYKSYSQVVTHGSDSYRLQCNFAQRRRQELLYFGDPGSFKTTPRVSFALKDRRRHMVELLEGFWPATEAAASPEFREGLQAYLIGHTAKSMRRFESEVAANPSSIEALLGKALTLMASSGLEDVSTALECCERSLAVDFSNVNALVLKANALLQEARLRGGCLDPEHPLSVQALDCYNRAVEIDARHPGVLYWKALAEDALGLAEAASRTFRQFVVITPDDTSPHLEYARLRLHHMEFWKRQKTAMTQAKENSHHEQLA